MLDKSKDSELLVQAKVYIRDASSEDPCDPTKLPDPSLDPQDIPDDGNGHNCYEYTAPFGYLTQVGRGVLFDHDWSAANTQSSIAYYDPFTQEWCWL